MRDPDVCRLRVPPEIVFDQGLGDIFDVRVAGNVAGNNEVASLEYAAEHIHVPLIVVMGHTHCGAVSAALEGGTLPGKLPELVAALRPAVDQSAHEPGDRLDNAVRDNVVLVVQQLRAAKPVLSELVAAGKLRIVGAVYSLETGRGGMALEVVSNLPGAARSVAKTLQIQRIRRKPSGLRQASVPDSRSTVAATVPQPGRGGASHDAQDADPSFGLGNGGGARRQA